MTLMNADTGAASAAHGITGKVKDAVSVASSVSALLAKSAVQSPPLGLILVNLCRIAFYI